MKEITRRLYTKPVMLGMAFLVGITLVVALSFTSRSGAAPSGFPVLHGNDEFETTANGESHHDFGGTPIPANFFGQGSLQYKEVVAMEGVPLAPPSNIDTVIQRHDDVQQAGGSTKLTMTGLSLKSINPIIVKYSNHEEAWNVKVGLSLFKASIGTMTINATSFDSTLKVYPRFTFTRVADGLTKTFDTGSPTGMAATAAAADFNDKQFEIEPSPIPAPVPCRIVVADQIDSEVGSANRSAAAASSCPPLTLTTVNTPWTPCGRGLCIPVPITEAERWARHNASPPGTKPIVKADIGGVAQ